MRGPAGATHPAEIPLSMPSAKATFILRTASTAGLWVFILGTIFSGQETLFLLAIAGIALLGLWEYFEMLDRRGIPNFKLTALICGTIFLAGSFLAFQSVGPEKSYDFELAVLVLFLMVVFTRQMFARTRDRNPLETMAYTLFGMLYVLWLFNFITKIVFLAPRAPDGALTGQFYVLYLILVTKFSDMGAYLTGSVCGRHPLVPHISPKKTWEGFFGSLVFSTAGSFALYALIPDRLAVFNWWDVALLGPLLGFAAVVGDLAESIVKRGAEAKDSGALLPGIGGVLDLIDSLLFTAPILFFYMRLVHALPPS